MKSGIARVALAAVLSATLGAQAQPPAGQPPAGQPGQPGQPGQGRGAGRGGGGFRQPDPIDFQEHDGWVSLFDGQTLKGWTGDSNWKVEDGAITIESTCEKPTGTIYLVWQGGEAADFELKMQMKGTGQINGGVQYRGWIAPHPQRGAPPAGAAPGGGAPVAPPQPPAGAPANPPAGGGGQPPAGAPANAAGAGGGRGNQGPCPSGAPRGTPPDPKTEDQWNMWGAQYDFDAGNRYTGQFYEQSTGRGIVAWKGQVVRTEQGKSPRLLATLGDAASIDSIYKKDDWNELTIIAVGNQMTHLLNGRVISILLDEDASKARKSGMIGLEVEATGKLFTKDIWLKKLPQ
jgi:hypothetical protein